MHINDDTINATLRYIVVNLVLVLIGLICILLNSNTRNDNSGSVTYDTSAENIHTTTERQNSITIPCWESLVFESGTVEQDVNFYNPDENEGIDFQISLYINDELYYKSGLIASGKAIKHIRIKDTLEPQETSAYVIYSCFTKDGTSLNGSKVNFILNVEDYEN